MVAWVTSTLRLQSVWVSQSEQLQYDGLHRATASLFTSYPVTMCAGSSIVDSHDGGLLKAHCRP